MTPIEPRVEAAHLRRLIESQPTCLMRVGLDGGLLAVNEAAQKMLGAAGLTAVLGTFLARTRRAGASPGVEILHGSPCDRKARARSNACSWT